MRVGAADGARGSKAIADDAPTPTGAGSGGACAGVGGGRMANPVLTAFGPEPVRLVERHRSGTLESRGTETGDGREPEHDGPCRSGAGACAPERDALFATGGERSADFDFGERTAHVFDDMLDRSIPQYAELQRMIGEIAREFAQPGTRVYDLGCSTGITLETLRRNVTGDVRLVGYDYSRAMLDRAARRFASHAAGAAVELQEIDLNQGVVIDAASVVVVNLTLQFIRPLYRERLVRSIYEGLRPQGCSILVEKVLGGSSLLNRLFISLYYEMKKRNGYSEMEIAKKREALENVLIPYRTEENLELLSRCGFKTVDVFHKWYNFCGFLAVKTP